jgi:hypothetical protein
MTRTLGSTFQTELAAKELSPFFAVEMDFDGDPVRLWGGYGNLVIDGDTYTGAATLLNISAISETSEVQANGITVTLSGIDNSLISAALSEAYQGRELKVYFGVLNDAGAIIDDPYIAFKGRMDVMTIDEGAESSTMSVTAESRLIDLDVTRERRYTDADQKIDFPDDKGLEFIADIQDKEIIWGGR